MHGWNSHPCQREARANGYCWEHNPDRLQRQDDKRHWKYELEEAKREEQHALKQLGQEVMQLAEAGCQYGGDFKAGIQRVRAAQHKQARLRRLLG